MQAQPSDAERNLEDTQKMVFSCLEHLGAEDGCSVTVSQCDNIIEVRHNDGSAILLTISTEDAEE